MYKTMTKSAKFLAAATAFLALTAHAELQNWRMTGTVRQASATSPYTAYQTVGNTVTVDYVVDTAVAGDPNWPGMFDGAITAFTVAGVKSASAGYISATGSGLNAINIWPATQRADKINFISFNRFDGPVTTTVTEAVNDFSMATSTGAWVDLRLDFDNADSVWIKPSSFAKFTPVTKPVYCEKPAPGKRNPRCKDDDKDDDKRH
jgi:hypothetical protein